MTDDILELNSEIKVLQKRIAELEREVASLRVAAVGQWAPTQPIRHRNPCWVITSETIDLCREP